MIDAAVLPRPGIPALSDLLEEVGQKNHVRVVKYAAVKRPHARLIHRKVMDELADPTVACGPALLFHDSLRVLRGEKPIYLGEAFRRLGGDLRSITPNLRTTVGADFVANVIGSTSQPAQADWIALSNNTSTPAAGDSSSTAPWSTGTATDPAPGTTTGEYTGLGLTRKQATYAHTGGTAVFTLAATWTATGTATSVRFAGVFGGAAKTAQGNGATNILVLENTFTATSLVTNDQLSLTWTVNV